jgi:cbb3-type cytochrome oxidase maturation protein
MNVIILIFLVSICIAGGFLIAFIWSVGDGQFDDDLSPSQRMLSENEIIKNKDTKQIPEH